MVSVLLEYLCQAFLQAFGLSCNTNFYSNRGITNDYLKYNTLEPVHVLHTQLCSAMGLIKNYAKPYKCCILSVILSLYFRVRDILTGGVVCTGAYGRMVS